MKVSAGLFVDDNVPAAQRRRGIVVNARAHLVVIDHRIAIVLVPNLDAELVYAGTAVDLSINGCEHEAIVTGSVNCARTLVLRSSTSHHQPIIDGAVEVQILDLELEFCLTVRNICAPLV